MPNPRTLLLLLALSPLSEAKVEHYVFFRAQPAVAEIDVSETQEKTMPTLEFPFRLDAACADPTQAARLSVNVADVRKSWVASEDGFSVEASLIIPSKQTSPVMADFCIAGDYGVTQLVRSVFTAQISLTCGAENSRTISYQSVPLDVELACLQPPEDASVQDSGEDSVDSPESAEPTSS